MIPRVLITGANGQLGKTLKDVVSNHSSDIEFIFTSKEQLDITNAEQVSLFFDSNKFMFCINCAAFTNVEKAEDDSDHAFLVNALAVKHL